MIKRLSHACFGTSDIARTTAFYKRLLGAKVVHKFKNEQHETYGVFLFMGGGTFLEFFKEETPKKHGESFFRHISFEVENIHELADKFQSGGLEVTIRRGKTDGILQCWITDPDGNHLEFQQHDEQSALLPYISKD